jgi:hypothetical protein
MYDASVPVLVLRLKTIEWRLMGAGPSGREQDPNDQFDQFGIKASIGPKPIRPPDDVPTWKANASLSAEWGASVGERRSC